jgi:NitT/TauT family transport system substrate-binding protein
MHRRTFLTRLAAVSAAPLVYPRLARSIEPPLETTSVRLGKSGSICIAPEYVAEELLRAEGLPRSGMWT